MVFSSARDPQNILTYRRDPFPYFARTRTGLVSDSLRQHETRALPVRRRPHASSRPWQLKAEHGDEARFLAGGQSLVPTMNFRLTQPAMLIDINPLTDCAGVQERRAEASADRRADALSQPRARSRHGARPAAHPRSAAPYRAPANPQSRHHRRQPGACRSGLGNARHRAGARRQAARAIGARRALDRRGGFFCRRAHHRA